MKKVINERDITKKMIKVMTENVPGLATDYNSEQTVSPSDSDVSLNQENFRQHVAMDAKFTEFSILPDADNVVFKGSIPGVCEWVCEYKNRSGIEIIVQEPLTLTEDTIKMFEKMGGFYDNWRGEWSKKLIEYKQSNG
jgi:hypothetical protein